jgi:hypothetical protein
MIGPRSLTGTVKLAQDRLRVARERATSAVGCPGGDPSRRSGQPSGRGGPLVDVDETGGILAPTARCSELHPAGPKRRSTQQRPTLDHRVELGREGREEAITRLKHSPARYLGRWALRAHLIRPDQLLREKPYDLEP